jgi:hypothetical protein
MDPEMPLEAQNIVTAYMTVLEQQYRANEAFPMPVSTLPYPKHLIKQSMRTMAGSLAVTGQLTAELHGVLEIAYTSLADYVDDELVQVMREYRQALSDLDTDGRMGREKASTPAWGRIAETGSLVARIARAIADEADALRAEFREFQPHVAAQAMPNT